MIIRQQNRSAIYGFDDRVLDGLLPDAPIDLNAPGVSLAFNAFNLAPEGSVHLSIRRVEEYRNSPRLRIRLDRTAMLASRHRFSNRIRSIATHTWRYWLGRSSQRFGIDTTEDWDHLAPDVRVVIFIHGLQGSQQQHAVMLDDIRKSSFPCTRFICPDNQPIMESASMLSRELKQMHKDHPKRRVVLLTFSMGGLVARDALEDPALDPGDVVRLMMIAPPNHGASLARFAFALEVGDSIRDIESLDAARHLYAAIEDGLSEAADGLDPDSAFLRKLNGRTRHPRVQYTIFLGAGGCATEAQVALLRQSIKSAGKRNHFVRFFGPRLDAMLADLDEVVAGKGDGAVTVKLGRLEGVEDLVELPFDHLMINGTSKAHGYEELCDEILTRLEQH